MLLKSGGDKNGDRTALIATVVANKHKKKRDRIADGVERANVWWGHKDDDDDDDGDVPGATESFLQQSW